MIMMKLLTLLGWTVFFMLQSCSCQEWWNHAVVYQIYPRSFQDSNGDGTGDLKGIESRLDYFEELGIDAIWLSPVYKSPMKDFGYDISDFMDIDPIFGTLSDFQDLTTAAHARGIKIIMDFVPNHSSDQHEWFKKSVRREDPYTDFYVWVDPKGYDSDGKPIPPNNWVSYFRFSAWEFNEVRDQFYLHQFVVEQPDLNYRNPLVLEEMKKVLIFWLDQGVDGFRFDAVAYIWEDERLLDEPRSNNTDFPDPNDYFHWDHIYTNNLPETRVVLADMYQTIKNYSDENGYDRVDMLEVYLPIDEQMVYYECSDFPFNFKFIEDLKTGEEVTADIVRSVIEKWLNNMPSGRTANWVLGNHDNWRVAYRLGPEMINIMNMIIMTLPGVAVTYQGEEIGMTNNMDISWEETVDPSGCNCGIEDYNTEPCSRDPERTPVQWSPEPNAGFTPPGVTPWLPVNSDYLTINVDVERSDPESYLSVYKNMVSLRQESSMKYGTVQLFQTGNVLAIGRLYDVYPTYVTVINFDNVAVSVDISGQFDPFAQSGLVLVNSLGSAGNSETGTTIELNDVKLAAKEAIVLLEV